MKDESKSSREILIDLSCHIDDRGFLYQVYGGYEDKFPRAKRAYIVGNFRQGVIRGLHSHEHEWKAYFVAFGAAKFVLAGEKEEVRTVVLGDKKPSLLIVPPGVAHGWTALTDNTILLGFSNRTLKESENDDKRIDPFSVGKEVWATKPR